MLIHGNAEANGLIVQTIVDGCGVFMNRARTILGEKGIVEIDEHGWYPLQAVLETLDELKRTVGKEIICEIGKHVAMRAKEIEGVHTFEQAMHALNDICHFHHRGVGSSELAYQCLQSEPNQLHIICHNPYPHSFNLGIIRGMARKFSILVRIEALPSVHRGGEFLVTL
ncbi:hypothetical protein EV586_106108 [Tumebacillus sp. BK434]|uniref:hypothetical protein n=1 Tax=Tumebacillus sp. BK434 TaxID=2512169 RepID=UPI00104641E1|nr:hypothetical protein [Tumebacillus sp. BK434]TCP53374.1 hypothetical protein EV586_106108 [Tumebacillus sp. BK434]